ncbi:uncharacterized protein DNG_09062 [Cephalotrichum gorgonifer]|uniref:HSP70 domain-containing protein n=1 Tax=Cephalotrichum gorgonifer TaxID=2041049 RepID=A0AAE8SZ32_9PEZI|nr:uncharacterized protein DNG_09062 [Cephalotrichum gorgonifer]
MKVPGSTILQEEDDRDSLIVALDFGTTFSGIAYSFSTDTEKIYTITEWPGAEARIVPKTPTAIWYAPHTYESFDWGYDVDMSIADKITALKLLFDPGQRRPYPLPDNFAETEIAKLPKPVVDVAADYMEAIFKHAMEEIEVDSVDPSFVDCFQKKFILTVPAVWSDKAKSMTLAAARKAGISPVEMITEPEAAALYTLHSMKSKGLQPGDAVVICDAGGGTVDLVSYEILSLDPFKLKALTAPSGGVCGSLMVNGLFEEEVRKTVGDTAYSELRTTYAYCSGLTDFDTVIKPAFRGWGDRDNEAMVRIFDPVVKEIESLVAEQITALRLERLEMDEKPEKGVAAIFLVGGFGSSVYLKSILEKSNPGVRVIQPREAWSAIVK